MAQQKKFNVCAGCHSELKLEVKYCPFCDRSQLEPKSIVPVIPIIQPEKAQMPVVQEEVQLPEQNPALISHITQKTGKELLGTIVLGTSLDVLKQYDRYAFKKNNGVFVRLKHLIKIPNEYLSADQFRLKYQENIQDVNKDEEAIEEAGVIQDSPVQAPSVVTPQIVVEAAPVATPLDTPRPKASNFKYIAIAFIVLLIIIFVVFNDKPNQAMDIPAEVAEEVNQCDVANGEISSLLTEKMPTRALSILKLHQQECKTNGEFVQLLVSAEAQAGAAKEKIALAKEYIQAGNLDLAHETVVAALDLDQELVGGNELLQQIQMQIEQQNDVIDEESLQAEPVEPLQVVEPEQNTVNLVAEQARKQIQAEQERQQAEMVARKQEEYAARKQNEQKLEAQLNRAEKALQSNNYGLAKSLAKDILSNTSNNSQAKRILRQAEQGESHAFDDMVIE